LATGDPYWWYVIEEQPGLVRIEALLLGTGLFVTGPGQLIELHFTTLILFDQTEVVFHEWHLLDVNAQEMTPVAVDDGLLIMDESLQGLPDTGPRMGDRPGLRLISVGGNPGSIPRFTCQAAASDQLRAAVYDVCGRELRILNPNRRTDTSFELIWDGRDAGGALVSPGMYLLRVIQNGESAEGRIVLVR
jgi:hypothetical protein